MILGNFQEKFRDINGYIVYLQISLFKVIHDLFDTFKIVKFF